MAATGSVWNANDWHWEEKSYSKFAKEFLGKYIKESSVLCEVPNIKDTLLGQVLVEGVDISGDASASIRKGKCVISTDLNITIEFGGIMVPKDCNDKFRLLGGRIIAKEIIFDNIDDDINLKVEQIGNIADPTDHYTAENLDKFADTILRAVKNESQKFLQKALKLLVEAIRKCETDKERLESSLRQRHTEAAIREEALATKGEEKQRIAEEQRALDERRKQELNNPDTTPQRIAPEGQGSVWNVNSYHWEEKPMSAWCINTLKSRLEETSFLLLDKSTELKLFNIKVDGEASISIRKGKKLSIFDLTATADWTATARDNNGLFLADSKGRLDIKEFCSEDTEGYILKITGDGKIPPQERIDNATKKELPALLKPILLQFVKDLNDRG